MARVKEITQQNNNNKIGAHTHTHTLGKHTHHKTEYVYVWKDFLMPFTSYNVHIL